MLFSTILVNAIRPSGFTDVLEEGMTVYMVYKQEADTTWGSLWQAVVNSLAIVLFMGVITFVMVLLYKYHCTKVLYVFLYFATFMAIGYTGWFIFYMAVTQYSWSWDLPSSIFIFFNLAVVSVISIFGEYAPGYFNRIFLVVISCFVCYLLSFFPDWTTWVLLVAMALYDMCAVLTPCGPLKLLINISKDRDDQIPGLLYESSVDQSDGPMISDQEEKEEIKKEMETDIKEAPQTVTDAVVTDGDYLPESDIDIDDEEDTKINRIFVRESVQLGLGDFIFYSLMVSKASLQSTVPFVFVFVIVLAGLLITMALLSVLEMALPALPFSMILGVTTFLLSLFVISKMINSFVLQGIMF